MQTSLFPLDSDQTDSEANAMARKVLEAALHNQWPDQIEVICFGIQSTMIKVGIGAYPYDCLAKDKYPNSVIYKNANDGGGWCPSHNLTQIRPGVYRLA